MPAPTIEELAIKLEKFQESQDLMKKDFQLKLDSATKEATQWKTIAEQKEAEAKEFAEKAKKADEAAAKAAGEAKKGEVKAFLESAKKEGKITPAMEEIAFKLMESMTSEQVIATFEKSDGSKTTHTQLSLFKAFISSLGKTRIFQEQTKQVTPNKATPVINSANGQQVEEFTEAIYGGVKKQLPTQDGDLHNRAVAFQDEARAAGRIMSYENALIEVSKLEKLENNS